MTRYRFLLILFLAFSPGSGQMSQQRPEHETWYDRMLRRINPEDIDYGAVFEERNRALRSLLGSRCFQFSLASTLTAICLMMLLWLQHISHRRAMDIAVDSIAMCCVTISTLVKWRGRRFADKVSDQDLLGLSRNASLSEVKKARREAANLYHTDKYST